MKNYTVEWFEARCADHGACVDVARRLALNLADQYAYERIARTMLHEQIDINIAKLVAETTDPDARTATTWNKAGEKIIIRVNKP